MRKATKDRTLVAIVLWIKELTEYLYQQEAGFLLTSGDLLDTCCMFRKVEANQIKPQHIDSYLMKRESSCATLS
jgi:hypothetical protein